METREAILSRRSVRKFLDTGVPRELILELIEAAAAAPSACNKRPVRLYVITDRELLSALDRSGRFTKISSPLAIVVVGDMKKRLPRSFGDYWLHDAAAATENILVMATARGLGSCWCGVYLQPSLMESISKILGLDAETVPFSLIRIGYPAESVEPHSGYDEGFCTFME